MEMIKCPDQFDLSTFKTFEYSEKEIETLKEITERQRIESARRQASAWNSAKSFIFA